MRRRWPPNIRLDPRQPDDTWPYAERAVTLYQSCKRLLKGQNIYNQRDLEAGAMNALRAANIPADYAFSDKPEQEVQAVCIRLVDDSPNLFNHLLLDVRLARLAARKFLRELVLSLQKIRRNNANQDDTRNRSLRFSTAAAASQAGIQREPILQPDTGLQPYPCNRNHGEASSNHVRRLLPSDADQKVRVSVASSAETEITSFVTRMSRLCPRQVGAQGTYPQEIDWNLCWRSLWLRIEGNAREEDPPLLIPEDSVLREWYGKGGGKGEILRHGRDLQQWFLDCKEQEQVDVRVYLKASAITAPDLAVKPSKANPILPISSGAQPASSNNDQQEPLSSIHSDSSDTQQQTPSTDTQQPSLPNQSRVKRKSEDDHPWPMPKKRRLTAAGDQSEAKTINSKVKAEKDTTIIKEEESVTIKMEETDDNGDDAYWKTIFW